MGKILEAVTRFFEEDQWNYERHPDRPVLRLPFQGRNGNWNCFAQERNDQILFYSVAFVKAPPERYGEVTEFITRANYGMTLGNFELDYSDGEVRYKTCMDVGDGELTDALIRPLVYVNCLTMDRYIPGLEAVILAEGSPELEVIRCETAEERD